MIEFTAKTIAEFLKGEIIGDPETSVSDISKIEEGEMGSLTFLDNPKYTDFVYTTHASIIIVKKDFVPVKDISATLIRVENPYQAIASLLQLHESAKSVKTGVSEHAFLDKTTRYGEDLYLGAFTYVEKNVTLGNHVKIYPQVYVGEEVEIGDNTVIYPGVKIYNGCKIGKNCIIHAGAVVGSDGFGFAPDEHNDYKKVPQIGNVILHDFVEIGANTTVDRATMGSTVISKGVKLDNLVQIAHNVRVGENTVIAAQTGIAGSTKIGRDCMFGGQVGITGHVEIAEKVKAAAQSGIASGIKKEGLIVQGAPAFSLPEYQRSYVYFRKLPSLVARLDQLEKKLRELEKN